MITAEFGFESYKKMKVDKSMKIYYVIRFPFSLSNFLFLSGISISLQSIFGLIFVVLFIVIEFIKIKQIDNVYKKTIEGYEEYSSQTKLIIPFLI
jgi:protein-S-isoprenylcysteine O-methyltransferase Ste14